MQTTAQLERKSKAKSTWNGIERRRVEKVVETLATLRSRGESLSEVAHDARNMVTALGLYCDLLEEPGVLATAFTHYAHELRLVAAASRRLVEKLVALDANAIPDGTLENRVQSNASRVMAISGAQAQGSEVPSFDDVRAGSFASAGIAACAGSLPSPAPSPILNARTPQGSNPRWDLLPALPVSNLAAELMANRNLLAALSGPSVALTLETAGGAQAVRLTGEDLTRLLVNLVKNAAEAMSQAKTRNCRIAVGLRKDENARGTAPSLALTVEDNGPGIPEAALEKVFTSGYTTRSKEAEAGGWPLHHRGLGLAIVRSIVEGAGGRITAANRAQGGACFTLELPVRKTGHKGECECGV